MTKPMLQTVLSELASRKGTWRELARVMDPVTPESYYSWLTKLAQGVIREPSVNKIQRLFDALFDGAGSPETAPPAAAPAADTRPPDLAPTVCPPICANAFACDDMRIIGDRRKPEKRTGNDRRKMVVTP